jgi:hypothetical protein
MQCPDCGYEADIAAVFCPQCRYQFRETEEIPFPDTAGYGRPVHDVDIDESFFEETRNGFSDKELRMLEVQMLQPSVLVVLIFSLFTYSCILTAPPAPVTVAGLKFGVTGIVSLACGLIAGIIFFFLARRSIVKFRFR